MSPHSLPESSPITRDVAGRAVDALLAFLRASAKNSKAQLFEHDDLLHLHLTLRRIHSTSRLKPLRVPLPHSLHPLDRSRTSLCLIVNDSNADAVRSTAAAENLPFDSVIPLSQLRTDYVPFESRRRLCDSYDIFFAERRILPMLPRLLGNYFFRKKKLPLAVDVSRKGWPEAIRQACRSTLLYLWAGNCCGLKVGRVSMDREQIVDNLMAAIEGAVELIPKKWANVRSIFIKEVQSVALPIYQVIPEIGMRIDVGPLKKEERLVVQEGVKKKVEKKGNSKKRKARIHDVDNLGDDHEGRDEEGKGDVGLEEQESSVLGVDKKSKKNKKERKRKLSKGKKGKTAGDDEDGGEFIELGGERKKRKKLKKVVNSEVKTCGKDHDFVIADKEVNGLSINADAAADDENGDDHEGRDEEGNGDVVLEEQESGALGVEKKSKKKKKERKGKLNKGKKGGMACDDEDGGEFIELGGERKKRKKSKKIVNSQVRICGKDHVFLIADKEVNALSINADAADDDENGDNEELQLKKRGKKNNKKRAKLRKGRMIKNL